MTCAKILNVSLCLSCDWRTHLFYFVDCFPLVRQQNRHGMWSHWKRCVVEVSPTNWKGSEASKIFHIFSKGIITNWKKLTLNHPNSCDFLFRHEVPVSSEEIKIIHMDDDLVVVNKPASIPVNILNLVIYPIIYHTIHMMQLCVLTPCFQQVFGQRPRPQVLSWLLIYGGSVTSSVGSKVVRPGPSR